jgi:hypothetical protein
LPRALAVHMATSASRRTASTSVASLTLTPTLAVTWTRRPWMGGR